MDERIFVFYVQNNPEMETFYIYQGYEKRYIISPDVDFWIEFFENREELEKYIMERYNIGFIIIPPEVTWVEIWHNPFEIRIGKGKI